MQVPSPDGTALEFEVHGALHPRRATVAEAPTFVLVHGIGASHRYFGPLHDALERTERVVSIDLPGFAANARPSRDLTVADMAAALCTLIATLALGPVVLVGHSMGAQWAVEAGRQRPELFRAIVGIGPVVDDAYRTAGAQARALALDAVAEPPAVVGIMVGDYLRCGVPWYVAQLRQMLAYPTLERARSLRVPLLIIRGGDDPVAGLEWCRRLRDAAPDATLIAIPGHRHVVQHSAPRAVASAIRFHTVRTE